ncbi:MAG: amidase family protein, partial [Hyphomicrobiales bacterium]|nr:amidase family protein [Hyphomicrobiales bacterium]
MTIPLWKHSASDLALAIREKEISSIEVIEAHLNRIEAVNAGLNAVVTNLAETALDAARLADQQIASGADTGPLHGVPFTIKDVFDLAGTATTMGIVELKDKMPATDTPVVAHLKKAGAIPIARTNVPDIGVRWHTDNDLYGATLNPWDRARTPGGSSGGEAAAIATGMSPLGIGGDMGGSLRFPAQCCGIAALKPGFGRISRTITS